MSEAFMWVMVVVGVFVLGFAIFVTIKEWKD